MRPTGSNLPMLTLMTPRAHRRLALVTTQLAAVAPSSTLAAEPCVAPGKAPSPLAAELSPLVEQIHAFTKASNTRVAIMATGAGSVRVLLHALLLAHWPGR
jgi:hypothetical protein